MRAACVGVVVWFIGSVVAADGGLAQLNPVQRQPAPASTPLSIARPQPTLQAGVTAPPESSGLAPGAPAIEQTMFAAPNAASDCGAVCSFGQQERFTGWFAGGELTLHEAKNANASFTFNGDTVVGGRFVVGYEGPRGYGIRGRLWGAGNDELETIAIASPHAAAMVDFSTFLIEADFYKRFCVEESCVTVGAGTRGGGLEVRLPGDSGFDIGGSGVGAFVELWHPVFIGPRTTFAYVAHGRASFLSGEAELAGTDIDVDTTIAVAEAAFGVEMRRRWGRGEIVAAAMLESQHWDTSAMTDVVLDGGNLRCGYQW